MTLPPLSITDDMRNRYTQGWRASEELLIELHRLLYTYKPRSILETGPGLSSILFYEYQLLNPGTVYISLNHPSEHHKIFIDHMVELGFDVSTAHEAPLVDGYYDVSAVPEDSKFDLFSLDGPPDSQDRASESAMKFFKAHCHVGSIFVQDDTNRQAETRVITDMCAYLGRSDESIKVLQDSFYEHRTSKVLLPVE